MSIETRDRLIQAATELFCRKGYANTSIREIAQAAQANSALIKYYFRDKEGLFKHVFKEVTAPLNQARQERFALLKEEGGFSAESVVRAWIEPMFGSDALAPCTAASSLSLGLTAQYGQLSDQLITQVYDEINEQFLGLLQQCLPTVSREALVWRLYFLVGAVLTATRSRSSSMLRLSGGRLDGTDYQQLVEELVAFASAGFAAEAR
ncbi:TetR/AcrR family transcriptional regulator [Pusillimonas sp. CC-YST705]|uniref:TetR/AcrR family transcriptional regulator n=1 Tax=Mesopusillimonas faecipullorum TaxID=2755040 RepID=A0ABS8C9K9_9BURK|nr:TetR/AcrR family transcriptional regulator [Mesopusillimonas faecipullorum]MCB5362721.1 TetR/AcrR family transcriptional regulator [Mesopusillimonas faecipullorum]